MITKFEENIYFFVDYFFKYLIDSEALDNIFEQKLPQPIKSVKLDKSFSLQLIKNKEKDRLYLKLFEGTKSRLELLLCRILFNDDNTILWYLDTPSHEESKNAYNDFFGNVVEIPSDIVERIKKQQEAIYKNDKFLNVPRGYLVADNVPRECAIEQLRNLLFFILGKTNNHSEENIIGVEEGILADRNLRKRTRAQNLLEHVRKRDNYTCQACHLKLAVNGKCILQVHHLVPLEEETITTMDDLASLCPTCHYIAHCKKPPYTIEEIKEELKKTF